MGSTYKQWADAADAASKKAESSGSGEDHIRASELHRRALNEAAQSGDLTPAQREKAVSKHSNTFSKHAQKAGKVLENSEYMKLASKHAGDIDHRSHAPAVESEDAPKGLGRLAAARGKGERTPAMFDEEKMSGAKARAVAVEKGKTMVSGVEGAKEPGERKGLGRLASARKGDLRNQAQNARDAGFPKLAENIESRIKQSGGAEKPGAQAWEHTKPEQVAARQASHTAEEASKYAERGKGSKDEAEMHQTAQALHLDAAAKHEAAGNKREASEHHAKAAEHAEKSGGSPEAAAKAAGTVGKDNAASAAQNKSDRADKISAAAEKEGGDTLHATEQKLPRHLKEQSDQAHSWTPDAMTGNEGADHATAAHLHEQAANALKEWDPEKSAEHAKIGAAHRSAVDAQERAGPYSDAARSDPKQFKKERDDYFQAGKAAFDKHMAGEGPAAPDAPAAPPSEAIQHVSTHGSKEEAEAAHESMKGQEGYLGGRVTPPGPGKEHWSAQTFHDASGMDKDAELPEGMKRVAIPPGHHEALGIGGEKDKAGAAAAGEGNAAAAHTADDTRREAEAAHGESSKHAMDLSSKAHAASAVAERTGGTPQDHEKASGRHYDAADAHRAAATESGDQGDEESAAFHSKKADEHEAKATAHQDEQDKLEPEIAEARKIATARIATEAASEDARREAERVASPPPPLKRIIPAAEDKEPAAKPTTGLGRLAAAKIKKPRAPVQPKGPQATGKRGGVYITTASGRKVYIKKT